MKILIGTPIHICKDYAIERWLDSISRLAYPYDLLLVDNTPGTHYMETVKGYCKKYGTNRDRNYRLEHIEPAGCGPDETVARSRELIRQEIIKEGYDAWFSLNPDVIVPPDTLERLIELIGNYMLVSHAYPQRTILGGVQTGFGISLVKKEPLEKYGFLLDHSLADPDMPLHWYGVEQWFMQRVRQDGGKYLEVYGIIKPIYHLNK